MEAGSLLIGIVAADDLLAGGHIGMCAHFLKEVFDFSGGLINIENFAGLLPYSGPDVRHVARDENGITGAQAHALVADLKFVFAFENVDPFVLAEMGVTGAATIAIEFENANRAVAVFGGNFAIHRFGTEMNATGGTSMAGGNVDGVTHSPTMLDAMSPVDRGRLITN